MQESGLAKAEDEEEILEFADDSDDEGKAILYDCYSHALPLMVIEHQYSATTHSAQKCQFIKC